MIPFAAPYKSVFFKYVHNGLWDPVFVDESGVFTGAFASPLPVIGVRSINIDGHAKAVHAMPVGAGNVAPGKGATNIGKVLFQFNVLVQFFGYLH